MNQKIEFTDNPFIPNQGNMLILMWGIRRSGNHCIRDWIEYQFERPTDNWMNVQVDVHCLYKDSASERVNTRILSLEEKPLETMNIVSSQGYKKHKKVVILRDPFNLFASRIKFFKLEGRDNLKPFTRYLWLEYAKFFDKQVHDDVLTISYNRFVSDIEYRKSISKRLGGKFDDTPIDFINYNSGGSSFDGTRYQHRARGMKVLERWKHFKDYKEYRDLFTDEIREYSRKIFNFEPF